MNKKISTTTGVITIIILAIIVIGGVFAYQYYWPIQEEQENQEQEQQGEIGVSDWNSYTYLSSQSGILPDISFKYPSLFGNSPTLISSSKVNTPEFITDDWGGFIEFKPGVFLDNSLGMNFYIKSNLEKNFENYVLEASISGGWSDPKYFQADGRKVARIRMNSKSDQDSYIGWYFIELKNNKILSISTTVDKDFLYDDDITGISTTDKIISTFKFIEQEETDNSNWKTYKNDLYEFEVKVPQGALYKGESSIFPGLVYDDEPFKIIVSPHGNSLGSYDLDHDKRASEKDVIDINGNSWTVTKEIRSDYISIRFYTKRGDFTYIVTGTFFEGAEHKFSEEDCYKIASSFKFFTEGLSRWQTYTNEEYGFEFEYPINVMAEIKPENENCTIYYELKDDGIRDYYDSVEVSCEVLMDYGVVIIDHLLDEKVIRNENWGTSSDGCSSTEISVGGKIGYKYGCVTSTAYKINGIQVPLDDNHFLQIHQNCKYCAMNSEDWERIINNFRFID